MSRIHEALKKAEQDKARAAAGQPQPPAEPALGPMAAATAMAGLPESLLAAAPAVAAPAAAPAVVPTDGEIRLEHLKARCPAPKWSPDPVTMIFFSEDNQAMGTEEFRTLRSRLYQIRQRKPLTTVVVSSALPGEGKSFVAANLAQAVVRQHGRSALLIDADLRWSRLHQYLGAPEHPGLTEYLAGKADEFAVIQRSPLENLFFIPGGKPAQNPAELLGSGRMQPLLRRMAGIFDWVIIDSPPAVPVTDASVMADMADGVLMVVEANSTPLEMATKARQEFANKPLLGVVLNRVPHKQAYSRYYYGSYGKPQPRS